MKTYRNSSFSFLVGGVVCMHFVWRENLEICSTAPESTQMTTLRRVGFGSDSSGCERCRLASIGNNRLANSLPPPTKEPFLAIAGANAEL